MVDCFRKKPAPGSGPDFAAVTSRAKAEELTKRGELERLYFMPLEFGGSDVPENITYVPIGIVAAKATIDLNIIGPLVTAGALSRYKVTPKYQGRSFVPTALDIIASNPGDSDSGDFTVSIAIWGDPLREGT